MKDAISPRSIRKKPRPITGRDERTRILVLFGTRPEVIKLAPVIHELQRRESLSPLVVSSGQHRQLLEPFLNLLQVRVDHDLDVMKVNQGPNQVCSAVLSKLDRILTSVQPSMIVVQGDTSTTLSGAMAAFHRNVPVAHVEAGLRSGNAMSPFPEEMNRRLVSKLASLHFAATRKNRELLLAEGTSKASTIVTGNPVVDSLQNYLSHSRPSKRVNDVLKRVTDQKVILLTTHRREAFGSTMQSNLNTLRRFVVDHYDVSLVFPVHPNPNVREAVNRILEGCERVHLLDPVDYVDFIALMRAAWLIVSDSGGVQEEAPSLGKPLLVLRENTERPEAITSGVAKLVGGDPARLARLLDENYKTDKWTRAVAKVPNPFGDGNAAVRIVDAIEKYLSN